MRTTAKLFVTVGVAGTAAVPALPAGAAETPVAISGYSFPAEPATIAVGDSVKWTNRDNDSHTVTADDGSFNSNSLAPQGTFTHTFSQAGTFAYHCEIHTTMRGTVQVGTATTTPAPAPSEGSTTSSSPLETGRVADDEGANLVVPGAAALLVLALGAGFVVLRRRRPSAPPGD